MSKHRILDALKRTSVPPASSWLAVAATAVLTGYAGFDTAHAMTPGNNGAAAVAAAASKQPVTQSSGVDALIEHLHDTLKITPEQESAWYWVATVMRENADTMNTLALELSAQVHTATALENLRAYADLSEAHTASMKRVIPVFQALYESLSPEQKKVADAEFRGRMQDHARQGGD
jgi:protein CpxP